MIPRVSLIAAAAVVSLGAIASMALTNPRASSPTTRALPDDYTHREPSRDVPLPQQPSAAAPVSPQVAEGGRLFVSYNCGDCHGAGGSGAMAPSLVDNRWRYGGTQAEVFRSIAEGRPGGMPAWGATIPGPQMIALTAYVRSLGEGKDLSTENFTGATVERSGR